jgi:iron complex outermembrane receptor protein
MSIERNQVTAIDASRDFITTGNVYGQGQSGRFAQRLIPGQPLGIFWGPEYVGLNAQNQQMFNKYTVTKDASGRITSRTLAGTTIAPTADDETIIGNANPSFSLGFHSNATWNKLDASWNWRGEFGRDVFNNTALIYATKTNAKQGRNFLASALDDPTAIGEPSIYSSRWIENGRFIRLQNMTVGYTFTLPARVGGGRTTRVYLSGDNLLLFTPYSGYDPEVFVNASVDDVGVRGIDYLTYPRARTFTTGARIQF